MVFHEGWWYVAGYCHLRREVRTFRLDRIQHVTPAEEPLVRPEQFDALGHVQAALSRPQGIASVEVLFLTSLDEARRAIPAEFGTLEAVAEGVLFRRPAYRLEWVAPILLSLNFPIHIVQPAELKTVMGALAEKALRMAGAAM